MRFIIAVFALLVVAQFCYSAYAAESKTFVQPENDGKCDMCKYVVGEVEQYMNSSEAEIEQKLVQACKKLPGGLEQLCDSIVVLYGHQIIEWVLTEETPPVICHQIGLCPTQKPKIVAPKPAAPSPKDDTKCDLCVYVVGLLEDYLKGNATEAKVKEALDKVCDKLGPMSGMCKAFVEEYEPQLIDLLTKKFTPKQVCQKIHLCAQQFIVKQQPKNDDSCNMCKFVVSTVEEYLQNNQTVDFIEQKLEKFCSMIGGDMGAQCTTYVKEYLPMIVDYLVKKYTPAEICQTIGACAKQQFTMKPVTLNPLSRPHHGTNIRIKRN